jgi:uncharacterized protein YlxP (DUF503 family)
MYLIYGRAQLFLPHSSSLKDKRQTIQSIVARIRKRFSISICEVEHHELWQRSDLGFAAVCNTFGEADPIIAAISDTLVQYDDACQVIAFDHQVVRYDD